MTTRWEYMTEFVWANIEHEGVAEYLATRWPNWRPSKFSPETMIPHLNEWGKEGWELIHMEPLHSVGKNADVGFSTGGGSAAVTHWSNVYFCVFKRQVE